MSQFQYPSINYVEDYSEGESTTPSISLTSSSAHSGSNNNNKRVMKIQPPIIVGYAFGPKKMITMADIMADASSAVSTVVTTLPLLAQSSTSTSTSVPTSTNTTNNNNKRKRTSPDVVVSSLSDDHEYLHPYSYSCHNSNTLTNKDYYAGDDQGKLKKQCVMKQEQHSNENNPSKPFVATFQDESDFRSFANHSTSIISHPLSSEGTSGTTTNNTANSSFMNHTVQVEEDLDPTTTTTTTTTTTDANKTTTFENQVQTEELYHLEAFFGDEPCTNFDHYNNTNVNNDTQKAYNLEEERSNLYFYIGKDGGFSPTSPQSSFSQNATTTTRSSNTASSTHPEDSSHTQTLHDIFMTFPPKKAKASVGSASSVTDLSFVTQSTSTTSHCNVSPHRLSPFPPCFKSNSNTTTTTTTTTTTNGSSSTSSDTKKNQIYQARRISFVPLDLNFPLEEQHGGKFDVILHKLTEDILFTSTAAATTTTTTTTTTTSTTNTAADTTPSLSLNNMGDNNPHLRGAEQDKKDNEEDGDPLTRIQRLVDYTENNPTCCVIDHPYNVARVMSRADIANILNSCLNGMQTKSGVKVKTPKYLILLNQQEHNSDDNSTLILHHQSPSTTSQDMNGNELLNSYNLQLLTKRLKSPNNPFTFPLIVKPLPAAGTVDSHKMAIVTSHIGLRRIQYPCILQEYTNHDGILYKVYVLGNKVWVFPRSSLPNLPLVQCTLDDHDDDCDGLTSIVDVDMSKHYVEFDSQRPYPTSSDFEVLNDDTATSSTTPQVKNPFAFTSSSSHLDDDNPRPHHDNKNIQKMNTVLSDNLSLAITSQEIKPVASRLRDAFGLDMFGFDVLLCSSSSSSASILDETISTSNAVKEMFVVDVNYFPSYKEVSNFPQLLAQYLAQCAIEGKNRS